MKATACLRAPARNKQCTISVRYTHRHQYLAVRTGLSVLPLHFDSDAGAVRRSQPGYLMMNAIIEQRKAELMDTAMRLLLKGEDPTVERVRDTLNGVATLPAVIQQPTPVVAVQPAPVLTKVSRKPREVKPSKNRFHELLTLYGNGSVHDAASTKVDKKLFVKIVSEFQAWHGKQLHFAEMDAALYSRLAKYFLEERGGYNNVFGKRIKEIKAFLSWAESEHNVAVHQAYRKWKVYHEEKEIVYLNEEEIDLLWNMDGLTTTMQRYRDVFLFSCLTGFRWSDIIRSKQMVVQNGLLTILTQKNRGNAKVPMNERIKTILDRYNGDLDIVPLPKLNLAIKELALRAGLDRPVHYYRYKLREAVAFQEPMYKLLSAHCGRRSFITNAFAKGFSVPEILEMIGSSDAKVLQGYMAITGSHLVQRTKQLSE
ncbi:hypothetical protein MUN81_10235 [Hymenobacter sp. 5317J-9]|uniref:hypothetical protein n=1 Tax=Hymenobacter sp. 5317J-9 TaxID=2932250 RepID=UPI001FD71473|nr:hypothetical protein [Hymenobacter sp. 5317J-9]UOQ99856.1 hypothetical protein MUN81_10235 [Hymenobacter sp. 5317J-9]